MVALKEIARIINGRLEGDGTIKISGIAPIADAKEGDITFVTSDSFARYLKDCNASAIILGEGTDKGSVAGKNFVVVKNPALAYAKIAEMFYKPTKKEKGISAMANISKEAEVSKESTIYPYAFINRWSTIAKNATIYPFSYIGENVTIGESTIIYPNVTIYDRVIIGKRVIIHGGTVIGSDGFGYVWDGEKHIKIPQLGTVLIEDDVEIGANVTIDRASLGKTIVKKGTKIDNLVQIAHNVSIGENSIIVAQVGVAGSTIIGNNVVLAGQVGVRDHINIGNNVKAAGQTGITKDVPDNAAIAGTPHMPYKEWLKLQGYLKKLPKLFKRIKQIETKHHMEVDND